MSISVPATAANLGPGFDTLALALDLFNVIEVLPPGQPGTPVVEVRGEGEGDLPTDDSNLVLVAMRRLAADAGRTLPPLRLRLTNAIPLGRGLGSSAAAIVGGLAAAAAVLGLPREPERLLPLALQLEGHPDNVVAALWGGFTVGVLAEGRTIVRRIEPPAMLRAVLLVPDRFASTLEARAVLPNSVSRAEAIFNAGRCALLTADLIAGRFDTLAVAMQDRLHQPQRGTVFSYLDDTIAAAVEAGAHGAALSGAGSSVIALATERLDLIAAAMARVAAAHRLPARTMILKPTGCGVRLDGSHA